MKLRIYAAPLVVAALIGAAGPLAADDIRVWHHGGRGDGERELIAQFIDQWNAANPDAQAILEILPEGAYNEQVQAAALAGDLPDLLDFDGPNYANYVWSGYLRPLNNLISDSTLENMSPAIIAQGTYPPDGLIYSLGQHDSGLALWGRRSLLEAAELRIPLAASDAWTGAEFEDALDKLQALDGIDYALDLKLNYGQGEWFTYGFSPIVQSLGGDLVNRDTWRATGTLDSDASIAALTTMQGWVTDGHVAPASAGDDSFYGQQNAALAYVGHWMWGAHNEALGDDLILLPMPAFGAQAVTGNGSWTWGITQGSDNAEDAARLLEFLLQDEQVGIWSARGGHPPATQSGMAQSELFGTGGALNVYTQQLQSGVAVPRPSHPAYPVITQAFAEAVAEIVDGADVSEALSDAAQKIDEDIEDNGGYPPFDG